MAKTDIWMALYINDFLGDTPELNAEESGAYLLLIFNAYKNGEIPKDRGKLLRISRLYNPEKATIVDALLTEYFTETKTGFTNKRADEEREKANAKSEAARANVMKRWSKEKDTDVLPPYYAGNTDVYTDSIPNGYSSPSPSPSPIPTESKEKEPPITPPQGRRPNPVKYDFIEDQDWKAVFTEWGQNKKNPYRKQIGAQKGFAYLLNLSGGDIETARRIVDHSLANNWAGLFIPDDLKAKAEGQKSDERLNRLIDGI